MRCAVSNIPLVFKPHADWRASTDRLDNSKGYTMDNVQIVCFEFNGTTQMTKEKFNIVYAAMVANNKI